MTQLSHRLHIVLFFLLFAISTVILLIASTAKTPVPAWGGYLDVGMWVYRDSLDFNILLLGTGWRTYFFLSILPHAINLWKSE
jgi:hypothetical protein